MPLPKKLPFAVVKPERRKTTFANRYELMRKIGSGNFGTAYLVVDIDDKTKTKVLKQIHVGVLNPGESVSAMGEARLLSQLKHSNIVQFHESFLEGQFFNIVTEYCEGGDLADKIEEMKTAKNTFSETQVVEWLVQLLKALKYMHKRRILHRDLKTRNIFVKDNMMKVGDFGISKILMGTSDMASTFVGTPYYMSPEVLKHEQYDEKCDIWSIGCVLYEMCCHEHAFSGSTLMSVMVKIVSDYIPSLPNQYSRALNNVLERLLDRSATRRPTAQEILEHPNLQRKKNVEKLSPERTHLTPKQQLALRKQRAADERIAKTRDATERNYQETHRIGHKNKGNFHKSSLQPSLTPSSFRKLSKSPPLPARPLSKSPPIRIGSASPNGRLPPIERKSSKSPPSSREKHRRRSTSKSPSKLTDDIDNIINSAFSASSPHHNQKLRTISTVESPKVNSPGRVRMTKSEGAEDVAEIYKHDISLTDSTDELVASLIRDGIVPDDPNIAETLYERVNDFESDDEEIPFSDSESSNTINDDEYREMLGYMKSALDLEASTVTNSTYLKPRNRVLQDVNENPVFEEESVEDLQDIPPVTQGFVNTIIDNRITKLRAKCIKNLGQENFNEIYIKISEMQYNTATNFDHSSFLKEIRKISSDSKLLFDVEQLVYLEQEAQRQTITK